MTQATWQDSLNARLLQRLLRPMVKPGVIPDHVAAGIFERSQQLIDRLSLLHQFEQRWSGLTPLQSDETPLVYAQWATPKEQHIPARSDPSTDRSPDVSPISPVRSSNDATARQINQNLLSSPPVVQAKFVQTVFPTLVMASPNTSEIEDAAMPLATPPADKSSVESFSHQITSMPQSSMPPVVQAKFVQTVFPTLVMASPNTSEIEDTAMPLARPPADKSSVESLPPQTTPMPQASMSQLASSAANLSSDNSTVSEKTSGPNTPILIPTATTTTADLPSPLDSHGLPLVINERTPMSLSRTVTPDLNTPLPQDPVAMETTELSPSPKTTHLPLVSAQFTAKATNPWMLSSVQGSQTRWQNKQLSSSSASVSVSVVARSTSLNSVTSLSSNQPLTLARSQVVIPYNYAANVSSTSVPSPANPSYGNPSYGSSAQSSPMLSPGMSSISATSLPMESSMPILSNSDLNRLTRQVERKLMRRLTVERERRGQ